MIIKTRWLFNILLLTVLSSVAMAEFTCEVDNSIMEIIATVEKHHKRDVGYEYLISFNNQKEAIKAKKLLGASVFLDSRTIDCRNQKLCKEIAYYLTEHSKIKNLDLGAYQINYMYHPDKIENYFNFKSSYKKACSIIQNLIKTYGYSWKTIARYHSSTIKHNYSYLKKISQIIKIDRRRECLAKK